MCRAMPRRSSKGDPDAIWRVLEAGIKQTLAHPPDRGGMDTKQYMELYNAVHSLCTTQKGVDSDFTQGFSLSNRGGAYLCGKELYERLKQLLETHLREIQNKAKQYSNEALLQFCKEERDQYTTAAKHNNHLFRFLNRHWVKQEIEKGNKYIYDVYTLHLVLWKELVVADTYTNVVDAASQ